MDYEYFISIWFQVNLHKYCWIFIAYEVLFIVNWNQLTDHIAIDRLCSQGVLN